MELPKYVRAKSGTYHFQRDYPLKLRHLCGKKTFTFPLRLSVSECSQIELSKKAIEAEEAFERQKLLISNSDPDALSATDLDKAATDFLRRRKLSAGQFVKVRLDPDLSRREESEQQQLQDHNTDYADNVIPEFDDVLDKYQRGIPLTAQERVVGEAWLKVTNKVAAKPKTLGSLWEEYVAYREIDRDSRSGKKAIGYWNRWISLAGDTVISPNTIHHINEGMDAYVTERQGKVKSQSLQRELSDVAACLRYGSRKHRLNWLIEFPEIKKTEPNIRHPLEPEQQIRLVNAIFGERSGIKPKYGTALLLCLQGGMMVSEIGRLLPDDLGLNAQVPHIKVVNKTKRDARKRIIPIVLGVDFIMKHLPDTIKWLSKCTESAPSATLKKIMRRTLEIPKTSAHCLRHTFRVNAQDAGVSVLTIASIAGWSDGERRTSRHLLHYGSSSIATQPIIRRLYEDSLKIHNHLLGLEVSIDNNVVAFKR